MTNPYTPPPAQDRTMTRRSECPVCGREVSRWTIVNSMSRYRCAQCKTILEVHMSGFFYFLWIAMFTGLLVASLLVGSPFMPAGSFNVRLAIVAGLSAMMAMPFRGLVGMIVAKNS